MMVQYNILQNGHRFYSFRSNIAPYFSMRLILLCCIYFFSKEDILVELNVLSVEVQESQREVTAVITANRPTSEDIQFIIDTIDGLATGMNGCIYSIIDTQPYMKSRVYYCHWSIDSLDHALGHALLFELSHSLS